MISIGRHSASFRPLAGCMAGLACLLGIAAGSAARAQSGAEAIYGVTSLDVAPDSVAQGVAILKQYRDAGRQQAGNLGVDLLQEAGWPNRFVIYETWKDQSAYDANEKAGRSVELRSKLAPIAGAPYDRRDYHVISVGPVKPAAGSGAVYMQLHLDVFPPGLTPALAAVKQVAEAARKGEGNLRYDVVQSVKINVSHMTLFGAWQSRKAFDDYEMSAYGRRFRDAIGPLLGSPYDDRLYTIIN
ncbi:MAG TPA: antibiotic biosynthesis monooxygenase [Xanthobacteraceae bacterium]|jgi:quinol monooxygenase YgiN